MDVDTRLAGTGDSYGPLPATCPFCLHKGAFEPVERVADWDSVNATGSQRVLALRRCPNASCHRPVLFVSDGPPDRTDSLMGQFPSITLAFDATGLPEVVKESL